MSGISEVHRNLEDPKGHGKGNGFQRPMHRSRGGFPLLGRTPRSRSSSSSTATSPASTPSHSPILPRTLPWQIPHEGPQFVTVPPDPQYYVQLLVSCTKQCSPPRSRHLFEENPQWAKNCRVLHARGLKFGFPMMGRLGNALVDLYSKSGFLGYAEKVLDGLEGSDATAWNSVLSARSKMGSPEGVAEAFMSMQCGGVSPDQFTLAIVLSACARLAALDHGKQVHCEALKMGFTSGSFCVGSLIDMYAKCDRVDDARRLFDEVKYMDTVCWTSMIAGYVRVNMPDEALGLFARMRSQGGTPDHVTLVTAIIASVSLGRLHDARELFMQLPAPNIIAWNAIISGHAQNGHEVEALEFFREMRGAGIIPTRSTLGSVLSAAANFAATDEGCQVHSLAIKTGLDSNVFVGSSLVSMYAKSYAIEDARKVFNSLDEKNLVTWNAMLGGYAQNVQPEVLVELFLEMGDQGFQCDEFTYVGIFGACASLENLNLGKQLHSAVIKYNFDGSLFVGNAVIDMYAKSGELNDAIQQFVLMPARDIVTWNAIIVGQVYNEYEDEALRTFSKMMTDGLAPDEVSFASILSACANLRAFDKGKQVHCLSIKFGLELNLYVGSSIINLYAKLRQMEDANRAFLQMHERNVVSRNALIEGYVLNNNPEEALHVFQQMLAEGIIPSKFTFVSILPACAGSLGLRVGMQLHSHLLKSNLLCEDEFLGVSLVSMYLRSQNVEAVDTLFSEFPYSSGPVFWTAIISGQTQNGYEGDALVLFSKMHSYNVRADQATFASVLKICADVAAFKDGKVVHSIIIRTGYYADGPTGSSLVDMYAKCGDVGAAHQVFNEMENKNDTVSWNSMLVGFAKNGFAEDALMLFSQMEQLRIKPDDITFLGILTACSHAGLVSKGRSVFYSMTSKYAIKPRYDHYACMIDLLARGGHLKEAEEFINGMPFEPDGVIWATMLSACRMHGDDSRGKHAAENLIKLEPQNSSPYVLLSNMCATSENWDGVKMVRQAMNERGVRKSPGCSWIVVGRITGLFVAGDQSHPDAVDIYATLKNLTEDMKEDSYASEHSFIWHDED